MRNRYFIKVIALLIVFSVLISAFPALVFATACEENVTDNTLEVTPSILENKVVMDNYVPLSKNVVPEIIGYENALSNNHIGRLYEDEGDDLNKLIFMNADGTKTMYYFGFPVKYVDTNGEIQDISLEIADSDTQSGEFESVGNAATTTFSAHFTDGIALSGNGTDICMVPVLPSVSTDISVMAVNKSTSSVFNAQRVDKNTIGYYYDDKTTVEYSLTYTGFKEDIVVKEYTGQTKYTFRLYTNGLMLSESNGSYYLVNAKGEVQATIGDIIIFTADEKNNGLGEIVTTTIKENEEYLLTIVVDKEYLADPDTAYPIRIDPTVEISYSNSGANAIEDITISTNTDFSGSHGSLYIGRRSTEGIARALMRFPGLDLSNLKGATVNSASLKLRDLMCESGYLTVYCYAFTGSVWNANSATWDNVGPNSYSTQFDLRTISYSIGSTLDPVHWYTFNITKAVQGWIDGNYSQSKGLIFKVRDEIENGSTIDNRTMGSYNRSSYKPSLTVTYTPSTSQVVPNNNYYLNNKYYGKYLRYTSSAGLSCASGLLSSLGSSIQWKLQQVSGGYVIRSVSNPTKYLGVPETSTYIVEIVTVNEADLPARCIWKLTSVSTGYRLQNAHNNRYLYESNSNLYTTQSLGDAGTTLNNSCVWRMVNTSSYSATSSTYRELSGFTVSDLIVNIGSNQTPSITKSQSNALWSSLADFSFSYVSGTTGLVEITSATNMFTGVKAGIATYKATHKPTNRQYTFKVYVDRCTYELTHEFSFNDSDALLIRDLYSKVDAAFPSDSVKEKAWKCSRLFSNFVYNEIKWNAVAGEIVATTDPQDYFTETLGYTVTEYTQIKNAIISQHNNPLTSDFAHFHYVIAARLAYELGRSTISGIADLTGLLLSGEEASYLGGWYGDATVTLSGTTTSLKNDDYHADLDGENIYRLILQGNTQIDAINTYYALLSPQETRADIFLTYISYEEIEELIFNSLGEDMLVIKTQYPDTYNFMYSVRDGLADIEDYIN